ncbi:MAG: PASTA domain-containing protein [Pseudonocardiales bacterium]|nr:PASTA domain-containing protein [Pseudonocardiales bacterium]
MTKQHSPDEQTPPEQHHHKVLRAGTNTKRPVPARFTLVASLGTLLVMLVWGALPHQLPAQGSHLDSRLYTTAEVSLTHSGLNRHTTYDAVTGRQAAPVLPSDAAPGTKRDHNNDMNIAITSSESPPTPPIPVVPQPTPVVPQPTPVVPHPTPVVPPVVPQPTPVIPHPVPVFPHPKPVVPHPVPVSPQPTPVFPQPVVHFEQVPNLVGDSLATAEQLLAQNGLAVGLVTYQGSDQPEGTVLQTSPEPNTVVPSGSAVNLVIAG